MAHSMIVGTGHYVPERVVTNKELEQYMDTSDEWIRERTGIAERRFIDPKKESTSSMAAAAARQALERSQVAADEIDFIVYATLSPEYYYPGPGVQLQRDLAIRNVGALDIRAQCSGFIYGLSVADQFIRTGMYRTVLVVASEVQSPMIDLSTRGRGTAILFGDGAGAAVLRASDNGSGILSTHMHSEGQFVEQLYLKDHANTRPKEAYEEINHQAQDIYPQMNGNYVFKHAVSRMEEAVQEALEANQLTRDAIDLLVPHQANERITRYLQQKMNLPDEKVYSNIAQYGNTSAATIPICLSELQEQDKLKRGQLLAMSAFGAGFTWASALVRW